MARRRVAFSISFSILLILLVAGARGVAQVPDSAGSRPFAKVSVQRVPFPVAGDASVPGACSFSPDGRWLAVARGYDRGDFFVYDMQSHAVVYEAKKPETQKDSAWANWPPSFNPKSDRLAFTAEKGLSFLTLKAGRWIADKTIPLPFEPWVVFSSPRRMAWSSDGSSILFAEDSKSGTACEVLLQKGETRTIECGEGQVVNPISLGPAFGAWYLGRVRTEELLLLDGKIIERIPDVGILARSGDGLSWLVAKEATRETAARPRLGLEIWDAQKRLPRGTVRLDPIAGDPMAGLTQAAFSYDGRVLVTGDGFRRAVIRSGKTGDILHVIRHYETNRLVGLALSPDGRHLLTMGRPTEREDEEVPGVVLWELTFE